MKMKTPEEWCNSVEFDIGTRSGILRSEFHRVIQQILLDGMKEGMRRAAQVAEGTTFAAGKHTEWEDAYDKGCKDSEQAILTASEQLTEKDLYLTFDK